MKRFLTRWYLLNKRLLKKPVFIMILCVTGTGSLIYQLWLTVLQERRQRRLTREGLETLREIKRVLEDKNYDD